VIAGLAAAAVAAAGGAAWWAMNSHQPRQHPAPSTPEQPSPVPPAARQTSLLAQGHWQHLDLVNKPVTVATQRSNGVLEGFHAIVSRADRCFCEQHNPTVNKASGVTIQNDGIHVDLSQEFTTGGGSASMSSRVAQVLYTATSLQPNAKV